MRSLSGLTWDALGVALRTPLYFSALDAMAVADVLRVLVAAMEVTGMRRAKGKCSRCSTEMFAVHVLAMTSASLVLPLL